MLSLTVLFLFAMGCCKPCVKPILPIQQHPIMEEVVSDDEGGLDEENTKNMLVNLELYKGALDQCNESIRLYNFTIKK